MELPCLSVISVRRLSVRLLPMEVITKQLDCCTASRINGSMVVTWVAWPKLANHSLPRPSSTAMVLNGASQRSSELLALTLLAPPAAPEAAVALLPVLIRPPPGVTQPAIVSAEARVMNGRVFLNIFNISLLGRIDTEVE